MPEPSRTPMLRETMDANERGRILSIYLRPWTLLRCQVAVHVPFLADLDVVISTALPYRKRLSNKVSVAPRPPTSRSFAVAWEDYQRYHIVSKHALRLIRNFILTQMPESVEVDEEDSETEKTKQPPVKVFSPWASLDSIKEMLQSEKEAEPGKRYKNKVAVDAARDLTHLLWGCDDDVSPETSLPSNKDGNIGKYTKAALTTTPAHGSASLRASNSLDGDACLIYSGLSPASASHWFRTLCAHGLETDARDPRPRPNEEQKRIIRRIIDRCLQECVGEASETDFRSEPLRFLLHGVPGAGKSEVLYWVRDFFEHVCQWTHGKEFVFLASQNSMAALIE